MSDIALRVLINLAVLLIIMVVWFVLGSRDLYTQQIVPLYYPVGFLLIAAALFVFNRWGFKASMPEAMAATAASLVIFAAFSKPLADNTLYRDVMKHYYVRFQADTLMRFPEYTRSEHNYFTVVRALDKAGVRVFSIEGGIGEGSGPEQVDRDRTASQIVYLINGDTYAIFDWNERRVLKTESAVALLEEARLRWGADQAADSSYMQASLILLRSASGESQGFYVYAQDGELKLVSR